MCHTPSSDHDADSCPFGHIDGICAGEAFVLVGPVYDKMVHRETDGSDPLVQEPKGKP